MGKNQNVSRRDFLQRFGAIGIAGLGAGSVLTACGGGSGSDGESSSSSGASQSGGGGSSAAETVTIHPKGNQMKFKETEFSVPADTEVELVFENTATSPSMQHNVIVLSEAPSQDLFKRIGQAGVKAGAGNNYTPDDPAILAATGLAKPGETTSVTFTTPSEAGEYGYVCTYPGHWAMMQGTMRVT